MTKPELPVSSSPYIRERVSWYRRARKNPVFAFLWDILAVIAGALVLSLLVKTFLIRSFFIPSASMENTLMIDDRIIVNELEPSVFPIARGDVVVFRDPGGWLGSHPSNNNFLVDSWDWFLSVFGITAPDSDEHLVKRVIGLPGDHVVCCDATGKLQINGKSITEPYIAKGNAPSESDFDVTVPKDSYWVMGDNRGNSADSRFHQSLPSKGFVNKSFMVGRAIIVSFPFKHFTWIDDHPNVFKDVPKP
jgi:signal peptidase I